jgi:signal transduction histidine kinase
LNFTCEVEEKDIDNGLRLTLYRIVQELLNNAVKYAQASKVSIQILQDDSHLNLTYNDDGVGFDSAVVQCGQGMKNIKNRAEAYMGRVLLETSVGRGCWIGISFPLENTRTGMA